ncbi:MAG TPA: hypothetical protein VN936_06850 [Candidatus Acidoferrum sp.]|nr:hypothetical protein [Candidatus Acidoferrum sp.]
MPDRNDDTSRLVRGIRLDLVIAVCALLISSVAACASWWQARLLVGQTEVLQAQLGAQVWPYVSNTVGVKGNTVSIDIRNDGLGPAIIQSFSIGVDGVSQPGYIEIVHALLGQHLVARSPAGDKIQVTMDSGSPGAVMRPAQDELGFSITSKRFVTPLLRASKRMSFRMCYCSIIPGKCWVSISPSKNSAPIATSSCPEDPRDLLHTSAVDELTNHNF